MLANSFISKSNLSESVLYSGKKTNNHIIMKQFNTWFIFIALLFGSTGVFAQITTYPNPICEGNQVTFTIDPAIATPGKTIASYKFKYSATGASGTRVATDPTPNVYTFNITDCPPGNWTGSGEIVYTDGTSTSAGTVDFVKYWNPVADFDLNNSKDTQCLSSNSFCFVNKSTVNPKSPNNPLFSYLWVWGDGNNSTSGAAVVCHSYAFTSKFDVVLRAVDNKGCYTDIMNPPGSSAKNGVVVVGTTPPDFGWTRISGPCFKSCYTFKNLSAITVDKVMSYQWDFGDDVKKICTPWWEPDSTLYTAFDPFTGLVSPTDVAVGRYDSAHFDTITHCYCENGAFRPKLTIQNKYGCTDSTRKTPQSVGSSGSLPQNIRFEFDVVTMKSAVNADIADSVCAGSRNSSSICFKQTPIFTAQAGAGDFLWDFGDPNDPANKNLDSNSWDPCHTYSAMGSFFPSITIKNICPDTTFFYYAATMVGPTFKWIDSLQDDQRDAIDKTVSFSKLPPGAQFEQQVMVIPTLDSIKTKYLRTQIINGDTFYVYSYITRNKYYADSVFYFHKDLANIKDASGNIRDTFTYIFERAYKYGVRVMGPTAKIEDPPKQILIKATLKNQCGPVDTVDFVNASAIGFKARNVWRQWDFGDIYAPQCTSFSRPHPGWPPITKINTFTWLDSITDPTDPSKFLQVTRTGKDTIRMWSDAMQQFLHSDHFFINNGDARIYPGRRNCNFSHDTLPRHVYPNWDSVYLWYRYGHDFMPWKTTTTSRPGGNGYRFTTDPFQRDQINNVFVVKEWDMAHWGSSIYLNCGTGQEMLTNGQTKYYHHVVDNVPRYDPISGTIKLVQVVVDDPNGIMVDWPQIDTMCSGPAFPPQGAPLDLWPGNARAQGILTTMVPDPFQMVLGGYFLISGTKIDTAIHTPLLSYTDKGRSIDLPDGYTLLPNSRQDFFEYVFRRMIQKCLNVKLTLADSLNNESADPGYNYDLAQLDMWDCSSVAQVQLVLGKPDARGMGKKGRECPGMVPGPGKPALMFGSGAPGYPGFKMECGSSSIWVDIDSLADRMDGTPCYLDAFTTWGVGTIGTQIAPGPGVNITPGGLTRNTFYTGLNWNPNPPSPWTGPGGTVLQYHMGGNAGTPPAADIINGYVTIGVFIGNGSLEKIIKVWKSKYDLNRYDNGTPLRGWYSSGGANGGPCTSCGLTNPAGQFYTYQNIILIDSIANQASPPPVPIPNGWRDDSLGRAGTFSGIRSKTPGINPFTLQQDTLYEVVYLDKNWPNCISDTVWYHNFWHINDLDPTFAKAPLEFAQLREKYDTLWVVYRDSIQDSVGTTVWTWGDNTATIDSFYYAGADISDGYYTHGVRRVRYNIDYTWGNPGVVIDSTLWPCGVYGQRQVQDPIRFYKRIFDSIDFIAPDILVLKDRCPVPIHDGIGVYPNIINISTADLGKINTLSPPSWRRIFDSVGFIPATTGTDTIILRNKCANPSHFDPLLHPYTNYMDTLYLRIKDTVQFTQFRTVDTALMTLPIYHIYNKTSWEIYGRTPGATINVVTSYIENTQKCSYLLGTPVTVGVIDTLHIYDASGAEDTIFCKSEPVYFADSVRYFRYDNSITDVPNLNFGRSRGQVYSIPPYVGYQFDTVDFWARDAMNPSDTLINTSSLLSNSLIEFRYFQGKWTHWDFDLATGNVTYLPLLEGHWDPVLRGGSVPVMVPPFPTSTADTMYYHPYVGWTIFYPAAGALGGPGIYSWTVNGWRQAYAPYYPVGGLDSVNDVSNVPNPTIGRSLVYNNGKGLYKKVGMFYWGGTQWIFICNSQYITFPYVTHRLYWDFGDGSPIYMGVKPVHKYNGYGRFKVIMASRDSVGNFDTCISFVEIMKPVAKIHMGNQYIGCSDTASFNDSSFVLCGVGGNNSMDSEKSRVWWFTLKYKYPNGLQGQDTIRPHSVISDPTWYYYQKGVYKVKLAIETYQGCRDTVSDSIIVEGPRPAFKLITDTIGCKPFRVGMLNMADSFDMRNSSDTPTLSTIFYWGDGQNTPVIGRRDTVWHVYKDTGTYAIVAAGRDALPQNSVSCPIVYTPDTVAGFQRPLMVYVKEPYRAEILSDRDTVCVGQTLSITNKSDSINYSKYRWERRKADSALTFIDSTGMRNPLTLNTDPLITKFDAAGMYKIILFPTDYTANVASTARCPLQDTVSISVVRPFADFDIDTTNYPTYIFIEKAKAADHFDWVVYDKDDSTKIRNPYPVRVYPPLTFNKLELGDEIGKFKVCLVAYKTIPNVPSTESCPDTLCKWVNNIYQTKVIIPNVFTPNNDGSNDFFKIDIEGETKYDLIIYNRWGTKVFVSGDKYNLWNGKDYNDGSDCANGTYFFIFNYKLRGGDNKTTHGTITLLREQ